jgi:hypothetical protein
VRSATKRPSSPSLKSIYDGIDSSVLRGRSAYWVMADRFRMDWAWTGPTSSKLTDALLGD